MSNDGRRYTIIVGDRDGNIVREQELASQLAVQIEVGNLLSRMPEAVITIRWTAR
jgi:hypothetical protein